MSHLWLRSMQQYGSVRPRDYTVRGGRATARSLAIADDGCAHGSHSERDKLCFRTPERWQSGRMRRFAKPLYGLTPVPRVRIPPSPPLPNSPNHLGPAELCAPQNSCLVSHWCPIEREEALSWRLRGPPSL